MILEDIKYDQEAEGKYQSQKVSMFLFFCFNGSIKNTTGCCTGHQKIKRKESKTLHSGKLQTDENMSTKNTEP